MSAKGISENCRYRPHDSRGKGCGVERHSPCPEEAEQFAVIDADVLALSIGEGLPIRSVGTFVQQAPFDLIFGTKSGIKTFADLKGKTIFGLPARRGDDSTFQRADAD